MLQQNLVLETWYVATKEIHSLQMFEFLIFNASFLYFNLKYPLLAGMLTSRPFDETIERSKSGAMDFKSNAGDAGDKAMIQGYAQRYIKEIFSLLDVIPRQMLLLLKMNDCLRHVDYALGSPFNSLVVAGDYASAAVYEYNQRNAKSRQNLFRYWLDYITVQIRIRAYEVRFWWLANCRSSMTSNKEITTT